MHRFRMSQEIDRDMRKGLQVDELQYTFTSEQWLS